MPIDQVFTPPPRRRSRYAFDEFAHQCDTGSGVHLGAGEVPMNALQHPESMSNRRRAFRLAGLPAGLAFVLVLAFALVGSAGAGLARTAAAPSNTSPPTISGTVQQGQTLTADRGAWTGTEPISLHQHLAALRLGRRPLREHQGRDRDDVHGRQAGRRPHAPLRRDGQERRGHDVGDLGCHRASPTAAAAKAEPANTSAPTISGTVQENQTLTADKGAWSGSEPIAYSYAWQRGDSGGGHFANIGGANKATYTLDQGGRRPHASVSP